RRLPGIGEKTATRLALAILADKGDLSRCLVQALEAVRREIRLCPECFNLTDGDLCAVCADVSRDRSLICVVEEPSDVLSIESSNVYKGLYHVLHGLVSPLSGIGPNDIRLPELMERLKKYQDQVRELIVATNPSVDGEGTFHHICSLVERSGVAVVVSRIASGIPMGGELKYMDQVTIASALTYRRSTQC
ncbi:MAG TPA: recombination mediator RecR, partial [Deltaproteobacteria bacterium]|nr:recombination mediator RecR [Deltaproteobacteria bacterium]